MYLNQSNKERIGTSFEYVGFNDGNESIKVAALDGVFISTIKRFELKFSQDLLSGFHGYDVNISIEASLKKYNVIVTNKILLTHFSNGYLDHDWYIAIADLFIYYHKILPISVRGTLVSNYGVELRYYIFINRLLNLSEFARAFKLWGIYLRIMPFTKWHIHLLWYYLKIKFYGIGDHSKL